MEELKEQKPQNERVKKPKWLRVKLPTGKEYREVRDVVSEHKLHTICESGNCPNMGECWGAGTATFMILGNVCTRSCGFCAVSTGKPAEADIFEPRRVAESIKLMKVKHAVITSVDRDDLQDGGSEIWEATVKAVRKHSPGTTLETLIPDFGGKWENLQRVIDVAPEIVSHNLETVRRLTKEVRIQAKYETEEEVVEAMDDLRSVGVDVLTLGQYLQPTTEHIAVDEFITPDKFEEYKQIGLAKGFRFVESSPLVRSSYHAEKHLF